MEAVFPVIAIVLFVLYCKEYRKNKKMVRDYQYINARLLELADEDEINYILINIIIIITIYKFKFILTILIKLLNKFYLFIFSF